MLHREVKHIDVTHTPELRRLAEEVQKNNQVTVLTRDGEELAKVSPARPVKARKHRGRWSITKEDYEAFLSSAGGWKGLVDTEALKRDIATSRGSDRPPVNL